MKNTILFCLLFVGLSAFAKDYKGGEIQSKQTFLYGKFETRFYASDISGVLSTFFLYEQDGWKPDSIWQEIDVEVFGKAPGNVWQTNVIWETNPAGPQNHAEGTHNMTNDSVNNWHTYIIEWTPNYIEWFIDGQSVRKYTDASTLAIVGKKPMKAMYNIWASTAVGWVGSFDTPSLPGYQFVDYLKVYDWQSGSTFASTPSFTENFDQTVTTNWTISTHTFDNNYVDFATTNVTTQDGYLVLAISDNATAATVMNNVTIPLDVTSLDDKILAKSISLYPNPTTNDIHLVKKMDWILYSEKGIQLKLGSSNSISLTDLPSGIYYVVIDHITKRVIKQ